MTEIKSISSLEQTTNQALSNHVKTPRDTKIDVLKKDLYELKEQTKAIREIFHSKIENIEGKLRVNKQATKELESTWTGFKGKIGIFLHTHLPKVYRFACSHINGMSKASGKLSMLRMERKLLTNTLQEAQRDLKPAIAECNWLIHGFNNFIYMPNTSDNLDNYSFFNSTRWKAVSKESDNLGLESVFSSSDNSLFEKIQNFKQTKAKCEASYKCFCTEFKGLKEKEPTSSPALRSTHYFSMI